MKPYLMSALLLHFCFVLTLNTNGQSFDSNKTKLEIQEASDAEQAAFKAGECDKVLDLMENEITFLANGRVAPSKSMIGNFCNKVPRPFKNPTVDKMAIYPLSETAGYTVRTLEYQKDDVTKVVEYVTKIWRKTESKWRISHLHSTVKEMPLN